MPNNLTLLPSDRFYTAFQKVQQQLRHQLQNHLKQDNGIQLTRGQFYLLRKLFQHGELTITDLSQWMNVKPATMSTIVDRLEKHGLIIRKKNIPDRRVVYVYLSAAGKSLIMQIEATWRQALAEQMKQLSEREQLHLIELLETLAGIAPVISEKG